MIRLIDMNHDLPSVQAKQPHVFQMSRMLLAVLEYYIANLANVGRYTELKKDFCQVCASFVLTDLSAV